MSVSPLYSFSSSLFPGLFFPLFLISSISALSFLILSLISPIFLYLSPIFFSCSPLPLLDLHFILPRFLSSLSSLLFGVILPYWKAFLSVSPSTQSEICDLWNKPMLVWVCGVWRDCEERSQALERAGDVFPFISARLIVLLFDGTV